MRPVDPIGDPRYTYLQIADDLQDHITAGELTTRLPDQRTLARNYKVAYQTARHAVKILNERGITVSRQGRGTFITPRPASETGPRHTG